MGSMRKGDCFEYSYSVTTEVYEGFINLFGDRNILHTNVEFAKEKGFDNKVVHGNILNGFISHFVGEGLPMKNVIIHSQEIKYLNPVYIGDELKLTVSIDEFFESVKAFIFRFSFTNQNNLKVSKGKIQIGVI
jgi:3-hydroxybutyryl-CoA dehydratase